MLHGSRRDVHLSCDMGRDSRAKLVRLVDANKYFISFDDGAGSKFVLRMLGCSSLIAALGFDTNKALPVTQKNFDIFNAADELDINCYAGDQPGVDQAKAPYIPTPDKAQLLRINDFGAGEVLALSNTSKAFRLECANDATAARRLKAFGFTSELALFPRLSDWDSAEVIDSAVSQNQAIRCDDASAQMKSIDWPSGTKYYLFYGEVSNAAVLHEVGCRELVEFVNPVLLQNISPIAPETAEFFDSFGAEDKFECLRGTAL